MRRQSFLKKDKKNSFSIHTGSVLKIRGVLCLCFDARERRFSEAMLKDMFGFFFKNIIAAGIVAVSVWTMFIIFICSVLKLMSQQSITVY